MENTVEKRKMTKKKKVLIIVLSILAFLIVTALGVGAYELKSYCKTPDYEIVQTQAEVDLIAHRGFRGVAPENTAAAFEEAGKAGFMGAECDVYRTKDGTWIISHDKHTYRMMDGAAFIEKTNLDDLMKMRVDNGSNIALYPDLTFCTFEEYIQICEKYGMVAVIELKGPNNTEYYNELLEILDKYNAEYMFISFHIENLQKIRELSDAPCWYLVKEITDKDTQLAKSLGGRCGIDFDYKKEKNTDEVIKALVDTGLEVGAWTVDDPESVSRLSSLGVKAITTDNITY